MTDSVVDCSRALREIDALVAGDLDAAREARLATHVMACADCAAELGAAERVEAELDALPTFDAPPRLVARIKETAAERLPDGRSARRLGWWPAAAAAMLAVILATGWWWREQGRPSTVATPTDLAEVEVAPPQPSAAEVARATEEARLALALVARFGRKTRDELRQEILIERVAAPVVDQVHRRLGRQSEGESQS